MQLATAGHRGCKHTSASPVPPSPPWGQPQGFPWNFPGKESLFLPFLPLFAFSDLSCWQAGARCWPRIPRSVGWQQHRGRALRSYAHLAPAREHQTPAKCLSSRRHGQVYRVSREMGAGNLQLWFYCSTRWVISSWEAQVFKSLLLKLLKLNWQVWVVKQFIITSLPEDLEKQLKEQIMQSAQDCHSWGLSFLSCHPIFFSLSPDIHLFLD